MANKILTIGYIIAVHLITFALVITAVRADVHEAPSPSEIITEMESPEECHEYLETLEIDGDEGDTLFDQCEDQAY